MAQQNPETQQAFASPEAAVDALVAACEANDTDALVAIFGSRLKEETDRIDDAEEKANREQLAAMAKEVRRIEERSESERVLLLGLELWPFPMPLVRGDSRWRFDTEAGVSELLQRRIGRNELIAIDVCREFVRAQQEYVLVDHDSDGVLEFAQKVRSSPKKHDGLFWEADAAAGEALSPFGPFLAAADASVLAGTADGYMGYRFKVLNSQGKHAPGGKAAYVNKGNMTEGYALVAWPVDYGHSGVMTFLVNHSGAVYEKDLGAKTAKTAEKISRFDPDDSWKLVTEGR